MATLRPPLVASLLLLTIGTAQGVGQRGADPQHDMKSPLCYGASKSSPRLCYYAKTRLCWNITEYGYNMEFYGRVEGYLALALGPAVDPNVPQDFPALVFWLEADGEAKMKEVTMPGYVRNATDELHASITTAPGEGAAEGGVKLHSGMKVSLAEREHPGHGGTYTMFRFFVPFTWIGDGDPKSEVVWATHNFQRPSLNGGEFILPPHTNKGSIPQELGNPKVHLNCKYYCDMITSACSTDQGEHAYTSRQQCLDLCTAHHPNGGGTWKSGELGSTKSENTLACRIEMAIQASSSVDEDDKTRLKLCNAAGPTGGGVCGTRCENYCAYMRKNCPTYFLPGSTPTCEEICATFPVLPESRLYVAGGTDEWDGIAQPHYNMEAYPFNDTLYCRLSFAANSIPAAPSTGLLQSGQKACKMAQAEPCPLDSIERPGSGVNGGCSSYCTKEALPTCDYFCTTLMSTCAHHRAQFNSKPICVAWCEKQILNFNMRLGSLWDRRGNTLGCRTFLATIAASDEICDATTNDSLSWCTNKVNSRSAWVGMPQGPSTPPIQEGPPEESGSSESGPSARTLHPVAEEPRISPADYLAAAEKRGEGEGSSLVWVLVILGVAFLFFIGAIAFVCLRKKKRDHGDDGRFMKQAPSRPVPKPKKDFQEFTVV